MVDALLLVGAILLVAAAIWAGDLIAGGIEGALGEEPIRDRTRRSEL